MTGGGKVDLVVRAGTVFDGDGGPGRIADVLVGDGVIRGLTPPGEVMAPGAEVILARGCWVTPGFVDMHTHYDAEVEAAPALVESIRHGVTTVVTGSCSLSLAVGDPVDLADMFCRVEAIPREVVLPILERVVDWDGPAAYFDHLERRPLGPDLACLLGHSTIRAAAMGMARALDRRVRPTHAEMRRMEGWLKEALDAGYLGLSVSTLPWDKMDGEAFRSRPMPSVFATWREYRRLARILRARGRVLQAVPNISTKLDPPLFLLLSTGLWRRPLKTTLVSMMDIRADRLAFRLAGALARLVNRWLRADFRMQALPDLFDLYADGVDLVVFEEFEAGAAALHLRDEGTRRALLEDPQYRARFKRQWRRRWMPRAFHRDLAHAEILGCPDRSVVGRTFAEVAAAWDCDPEDAFLDLVCRHGRALRWYTVMGNDRPRWLRWIVSHPDVLIGFSDAGAHLRNMAHYHFPLQLLRLALEARAAGEPFLSIGRAVQRLTSEITDWLGLPGGRVRAGERANLVVVDPDGLDERLDVVHEEPVAAFGGLRRLVRRSEGAVRATIVGGRCAWRDGRPHPLLGRERGFGRLLRVGVEETRSHAGRRPEPVASR